LGAIGAKGETLGSRLDARGGIGPGFDHLRISLSLAILFWHSFGISYGSDWTFQSPVVHALRPLIGLMLPVFFALSGFLVMGSAIRIGRLRTFIAFRILRIVPALATEITLSALLLGPIFTAYPLARYFGDPRFIEYFGSLVGRVRFVLPGLFLDTPTPEVVNGALWTVGPEILCYILMSALILTALYRTARGVCGAAIGFALLCIISDIAYPLEPRIVVPVKALVLAFLAGAALFQMREAVRWSPWLGLTALAMTLSGLGAAQMGGPWQLLVYPAMLPAAYLTAFIGLADLPRPRFLDHGDYSYGIYIFGFPIQQMITQLLPDYRIWWINFAIALPLTILCAVLSWRFIEKPALGLRRLLLPKDRDARTPPPRQWRARHYGLAAALALYGVVLSSEAFIFPVRTVAGKIIRGLSGKPPATPGI
jgi:peptidoglycan/LPS O-acetylase OafA/YrhL